jgi:PhzF family phenazine biosynthesis protein
MTDTAAAAPPRQQPSRRRRVRFHLVDVFADEPLAGNPLAVVPDADALDEAVMRRIAREFNQTETTFLLAPALPDADWRLRCFTPGGVEVFGAGHNALGAWWWLADSGALDRVRDAFRQQLGDRVLPVTVEWEPDGDGSRPRRIGMRQAPPTQGAVARDPAGLARALGLSGGDLATDRLPAQVVSTGAGHLLVPAAGRAAVDRAQPVDAALTAYLRESSGQGCYLFALDTLDPAATAYARFFNPSVGNREDSATGSAAGPLACHLLAHGIVEAGASAAVVIEQGHAMGRPSRIEVLLDGSGVPTVRGGGVTVAEGSLVLP